MDDLISRAKSLNLCLVVLLIAAVVYAAGAISPPSLMDDVDAVQAQIARNMLDTGDWVTARLDGVAYLEKAPLIYWLIAISYKLFGVSDWAARIPIALSAIALCCLTAAFGIWAFDKRAGFFAGLVMSTCVGLFLFTRILIPDVTVTLTIALAMWSFLRLDDREERRPRLWALIFSCSLGVGLLLKSLIGVVFPVATIVIYLALTGRLFSGETWKRLRPLSGLIIILIIAAPWHILATLRNPPWFDFTMHSAPGEYHGFFWFFFINEQLLRFLNLRYPRDYNTVPVVWFWLFHLVWLFPWSAWIPAIVKLSFKPVDRAGRTRLLALCWTGVILVFFSFSTTQEYYSMPCYPALALLLGSALASPDNRLIRGGTRVICVLASLAAVIALTLSYLVRAIPTPGDIATALSSHPAAYTLSLGHIEDLTFSSLAYLRAPLLLAGLAFLAGALCTFRARGTRALVGAALLMVLFLHAARMALVVFDPYMSSRTLAEAINRAPPGDLIVDHHYYTYSSVFFYTNRTALLLNGRFNNLVYGSYAPGAPDVFLDDTQFGQLWKHSKRCYLVVASSAVPRIERLTGMGALYPVAHSGGKVVLTNQPLNSEPAPQPGATSPLPGAAGRRG